MIFFIKINSKSKNKIYDRIHNFIYSEDLKAKIFKAAAVFKKYPNYLFLEVDAFNDVYDLFFRYEIRSINDRTVDIEELIRSIKTSEQGTSKYTIEVGDTVLLTNINKYARVKEINSEKEALVELLDTILPLDLKANMSKLKLVTKKK